MDTHQTTDSQPAADAGPNYIEEFVHCLLQAASEPAPPDPWDGIREDANGDYIVDLNHPGTLALFLGLLEEALDHAAQRERGYQLLLARERERQRIKSEQCRKAAQVRWARHKARSDHHAKFEHALSAWTRGLNVRSRPAKLAA